jgi:hypothetical protein
MSAFQVALQHNPQNIEVSMKIKRLTQLAREKKRALDVESMRSNIDIGRNFQSLKTELMSLLLGFVDVIIFRVKGKSSRSKSLLMHTFSFNFNLCTTSVTEVLLHFI